MPIFTKHQSKLEQDWEEVIRLIARKERQLNQPTHALPDYGLEGFLESVEALLIDGNSAFRKAYLQLFFERVDVDDEIRFQSGAQVSGS